MKRREKSKVDIVTRIACKAALLLPETANTNRLAQ